MFCDILVIYYGFSLAFDSFIGTMPSVSQRMSRIKNFFRKPEKSSDGPSVISGPISVTHNFHVKKNEATGALEGLPEAWLTIINRELT